MFPELGNEARFAYEVTEEPDDPSVPFVPSTPAAPAGPDVEIH